MTVTPPIPLEAIEELEQRLGRSLEGWDKCPPRHVSPQPEDATFDIDEVVRVVRVLRKLKHTKDRWAGTPFEPEPWQIVWVIAPVFGWKDPEGFRVARKLWLEIPRKNGKSSLASRLAVFLLVADRQMGAEVYAAATAETQARQVFDEAKLVVQRASVLKGKVEVLASVIRAPRTAGIFRVLSRVGDTAHGLNVSGAVVDEVHLHKNKALIEAIETGTGARSQPLVVHITTAGDDDDTTVYARKHTYAVKVADGKVSDPSIWVTVFAADPKADPLSEETFASANPNYPISPTRRSFEDAVRVAREIPAELASYKRLHLNIRGTTGEQAWDGTDAWSTGLQLVTPDKVKGKPVWLGLVASSASDLTAVAVTSRNPQGTGWWCWWRWFCPEESLEFLDRRTEGQASVWASEGRIELTGGNVIDVARHTEVIRELAKTYDMRELAFDPNGAVGVISPIVEEYDDRVVPIYATNPASALLDWERLLRAGEFHHGGDPIATWQVAHLRVKESAAKIVKIDRKLSTENVLGIAAAELALRRALLAAEPRRSAYIDNDLMTV